MTTITKHCLLVVDDEPDVCDSVHDLLRHDFRVLKAGSAADGWRIMQDQEVHIVMTDQRMPQMTGVELLSQLRTRYPQAIRMLFTGYADVEAIIGAINLGHAFRFLKKPWQPEELEAVVREAAVEFDRLVQEADEMHQLQLEVGDLRKRVAALEEEISRLRASRS